MAYAKKLMVCWSIKEVIDMKKLILIAAGVAIVAVTATAVRYNGHRAY